MTDDSAPPAPGGAADGTAVGVDGTAVGDGVDRYGRRCRRRWDAVGVDVPKAPAPRLASLVTRLAPLGRRVASVSTRLAPLRSRLASVSTRLAPLKLPAGLREHRAGSLGRRVGALRRHARLLRPRWDTPRARLAWGAVAAPVLVLLVLTSWSVGGALTAPGTDSVAARLAEWAATTGSTP